MRGIGGERNSSGRSASSGGSATAHPGGGGRRGVLRRGAVTPLVMVPCTEPSPGSARAGPPTSKRDASHLHQGSTPTGGLPAPRRGSGGRESVQGSRRLLTRHLPSGPMSSSQRLAGMSRGSDLKPRVGEPSLPAPAVVGAP